MLKFLRKYNKFILVVGGGLLMVAFLLQGSLNQCAGDPRRIAFATLGGKKISQFDYNRAANEVGALQRLAPITVFFLDESRRVEHWILLSHEAERAGLVGDDEDGRSWIPELAQQAARFESVQRLGIDDPALVERILGMPQFQQQIVQLSETIEEAIDAGRAQVAADFGMREEDLDRGLAKARGIGRLLRAYQQAARVSDVRAIAYADRERESAYVDVAFVPAEAVIDEVPEPTEEELRAHLERFSDTRPGGGEYGIGYLLPPRVRLEWLTLDRSLLQEGIELDPVEVHKRWSRDVDQYSGDFQVDRGTVARQMRQEIVDRIIEQADRAVRAAVEEAVRPHPDDGPYKVLPEGWVESGMPRLEEISQAVVERVRENLIDEPVENAGEGITIAMPAVQIRDAQWLTRQDLSATPGIGRAAVQIGRRRISFPDLAVRPRELDGDLPIPVQVGVPFTATPLEDAQRNRYYFTLFDVRDESPPDSLEEVAEEARDNAMRLAAYERLVGRTEELRAVAIAEGLDGIVELFRPAPEPSESDDPEMGRIERDPVELPNEQAGDLESASDDTDTDADEGVGADQADADTGESGSDDPPPPSPVVVYENIQVLRNGLNGRAPEVNAESFFEQVLDAVSPLDPLVPMDEQPVSDRTVVAPVPESLGVAVARIVGLLPLTIEQARVSADIEAQALTASEFAEVAEAGDASRPFTFETLASRLDFQYAGRGRGLDADPLDDADEEGEEPAPEG